MTANKRRKVARLLRTAARRIAEQDEWYIGWNGVCLTITKIQYMGYTTRDNALRAFKYAMNRRNPETFYWPCDENHRSVRVIALLLTAEAVLTGDCDD